MTQEYKSMMTYQVNAEIHDVKLYNDDTGHGQTWCGIRVSPWHVTAAGPVTCKKCRQLEQDRGKHA